MNRAFRCLLLASALGLSACGFHLRGNYPVPEFLRAVTPDVPADATVLRQGLERALERAGIAEGGEYSLTLTRESIQKQTAVVDERARAAEYLITYELDYLLKSKDNERMIPSRQIILRRSYQTDPNHVSGKSAEEELIIREMREDALNQLMRQIAFLKPESFVRTAPSTGTTAKP